MIKKFFNLIDQDHFGDVNKVFVCKINENFIFETIFNVTPLLRLPKHTFGKFHKFWCGWAKLTTPK